MEDSRDIFEKLLNYSGELGAPVKGVILAGNFYEVLMEGYAILGNDIRNNGSIYSPTVKLDKITVAGK